MASEYAARLALERGAVIRPVDEMRNDQRRCQRQYDEPANGDE